MTIKDHLSFCTRLEADAPILMDGAMGTELTRSGPSLHTADWIETTLGAADDVTFIHRAYANAGAQIHIANTFATARHVLGAVGLEDRFEDLNRGAVDLCRNVLDEDRGGDQWIAGSVSTYVIGSDRAGLPDLPALRANVSEQCRLLAEAGCALIALEMLYDVKTSIKMMQAATEAGLPVSVGLTCLFDPDGAVRLRGEFRGRPGLLLAEALPDIVAAVTPGTPWILAIMHSDLDVTDDAHEIVRDFWDGPVAIYPNSGALMPPDNWDFEAVCAPETFVSKAEKWVANGVSIIGGCCGIGPDHIKALGAAFAGDKT